MDNNVPNTPASISVSKKVGWPLKFLGVIYLLFALASAPIFFYGSIFCSDDPNQTHEAVSNCMGIFLLGALYVVVSGIAFLVSAFGYESKTKRIVRWIASIPAILGAVFIVFMFGMGFLIHFFNH
jgi:hypothetical protein